MCRDGLLAKHKSLDIGGLLCTPQTLLSVVFWKLSHQYLFLNNFTVPVWESDSLTTSLLQTGNWSKQEKNSKVPTGCGHPVWEIKGPAVLTRGTPQAAVPILSQKISSCVEFYGLIRKQVFTHNWSHKIPLEPNMQTKEIFWSLVYQTLVMSPLIMGLRTIYTGCWGWGKVSVNQKLRVKRSACQEMHTHSHTRKLGNFK